MSLLKEYIAVIVEGIYWCHCWRNVLQSFLKEYIAVIFLFDLSEMKWWIMFKTTEKSKHSSAILDFATNNFVFSYAIIRTVKNNESLCQFNSYYPSNQIFAIHSWHFEWGVIIKKVPIPIVDSWGFLLHLSNRKQSLLFSIPLHKTIKCDLHKNVENQMVYRNNKARFFLLNFLKFYFWMLFKFVFFSDYESIPSYSE